MWRRVVTLKLADVSEVCTASIRALMMEAVGTSETSVNFNVTTRRYSRRLNFKTTIISKTYDN
jgi:hypothetical protein